MREDIKNKNILLIGDTIIDEDHFIDVVGLSLESPTLKGNLNSIKIKVGGAANVASHLTILGCNVTFVTAIKREYLLKDKCINLINVVKDRDNIKSRYWIQKSGCVYKYLQINDCEKNELKFDFNLSEDLKYDLVAVSDYRCGLLNLDLIHQIEIQKIKKIAASQKSDKQPNYDFYSLFDVLVVNEDEYRSLDQTNKKPNKIIVTLGKDGAKKIFDDKEINYKPYFSVVKNTIGAGDAFYAAYLATESVDFANKWASYFTSKGTCEHISVEDYQTYAQSYR